MPVSWATSPVHFPSPLNRHGLRHFAGFFHNLDLAGLDHDELEVPLAGLKEFFPISKPLERC
jgi:hypothetical protein